MAKRKSKFAPWTKVPMTTSANRSVRRSCWRGCAARSDAPQLAPPHQGTHPGDQFVRIARHKAFRKLGTGRYEIRGEPRPTGLTGLYTHLKRLIIGEPLATAAAGHERLTKLKALAVLSSDALSSVAYATEEIMRVLLLAGTVALSTSLGIGAVLVVLLFVVGFSYRQTIKAYPTGGGSYIVAQDNLGTLPGLAAAGSLLTSYTLTVAVSVAAGVKALTSAYPQLDPISAEIGVAVVVLITLINLPGIPDGAHDPETVVSQIAHGVFGDSPMYYAVQYSTFLILFLAANTAYSDFPRLAYFLGRDRFLPHQFTFRGDRLAYSVGIVVLGIASSVVLWLFGGSISRLIPLYSFGVFSAFTLSQSGMVMRWWRRREQGWQRSIVVNGIGALDTLLVLLVVAVTKFSDGAWMVVVILPAE